MPESDTDDEAEARRILKQVSRETPTSIFWAERFLNFGKSTSDEPPLGRSDVTRAGVVAIVVVMLMGVTYLL